ncbi:AaceriADR195Cp [[Ashbya] aceris (nom. inval.)]|nr:AaceriADR195Cp [[Ashbya] aceris (nom. inval.)]
MSTAGQAKRSFEEQDGPYAQETKRRGNKPGRKPLDTEAKNRRTAQNRAAQRAFRERKERKMRDLEDQVRRLEEERSSAECEVQSLRGHVIALVRELRRWRPESTVLATLMRNPQLDTMCRGSTVLQEPEPSEGDSAEDLLDGVGRKAHYALGVPGPDSALLSQVPSPYSSASSFYGVPQPQSSSFDAVITDDDDRISPASRFSPKPYAAAAVSAASPEAPDFSNTWGNGSPGADFDRMLLGDTGMQDLSSLLGTAAQPENASWMTAGNLNPTMETLEQSPQFAAEQPGYGGADQRGDDFLSYLDGA